MSRYIIDNTEIIKVMVAEVVGSKYALRLDKPHLIQLDFNGNVVKAPFGFAEGSPEFLSAAGPVFGTETLSLVGLDIFEERRTETAAGAHLGGGIDFIAGRHFMLGISAGYNLISDFDDPIGGHVNYSGGEFGVGFGFVF